MLEMRFLGIVLLILLCDFSLGDPVPVDTIIVQVQQWGVLGTQRVVDQVLLNGVPLTGKSQEVDLIIRTMSADALLLTLISVYQTSVQINHTVLRSRECILEGSKLHWTDRVFYDGKVYLTLDHTDTWTANVPEALAFKVLWDQEEQRTKTERTNLQEGCVKLMRELRLSEEKSVPWMPYPLFMITFLSLLVMAGLTIIIVLLSEHGVLGSIVHYPKDMTETAPHMKGSGYHTL
ncbi:uncharacterized protein LOC119499023 isoform X2 [Sebastes umbrosus]|uniref:uncharacterized protein LOC119499023 isoform X2 n=1 Tax=Sebastes umbrosus TaxID=72105 RepID=UPI00189F3C42|nr:uncharacterized protein LOC119499023 isoform X2 [Sebastes umbrosus]